VSENPYLSLHQYPEVLSLGRCLLSVRGPARFDFIVEAEGDPEETSRVGDMALQDQWL
jgi:hypothetical protein